MSLVRQCRSVHIPRCSCRAFSSTQYARETDVDDEKPRGDDIDAATKGRGDSDPRAEASITYEEWIATEGQKWRNPDDSGPKWLGINVPFPLNRSFKPPTPVSDKLREKIYDAFVKDPIQNDLRTLSARYGISMQRIEAIIRLKKLEKQWENHKPLQTGFLKGMERLLGRKPGDESKSVQEELETEGRRDLAASDEVSRQIGERGQSRKRGISRTFFEPVDEHAESVLSHLLEEQRLDARTSHAKQATYPTMLVQPDSTKPAYRFIDVGLRWVDRADMERRAKESVRRKVIKAVRKKKSGSEQGDENLAVTE